MNWLLLRGLAREQRHWGSFPEAFARALGVRVHCLDLPGTGTENGRPTPTTLPEIADDVRARWTALRDSTPGPWSLLGISLGGMVSMQWVGAHPEDFERVVLLNTSASNLSRPWERLDLGVVPGIAKALFDRDPVRRERRILSVTAKLIDDERAQATAETWATFQADRPVARTTVLRQLWAASRFRAPVSLTPPTLVLCAAEDPLTNPKCAKRLADHFGAPLLVHPTAGHDLPLDDPQWLTTQVREWVASHPTSDATATSRVESAATGTSPRA